MTNLELLNKIKAEIERLKAENYKIRCQHNAKYCTGYDDAFSDLLPFIDSLLDEKSSKDLEKAVEEYALLFEERLETLKEKIC